MTAKCSSAGTTYLLFCLPIPYYEENAKLYTKYFIYTKMYNIYQKQQMCCIYYSKNVIFYSIYFGEGDVFN